MTHSQVICDRCQGVILENRTVLKVECGVVRTRDGLPEVDLCADCGDGLSSYLKGVPDCNGSA